MVSFKASVANARVFWVCNTRSVSTARVGASCTGGDGQRKDDNGLQHNETGVIKECKCSQKQRKRRVAVDQATRQTKSESERTGMREMKGQCEWQEASHRRLAFKYVSPWTPDGDVYRHTPFHHHVSGMDAWREGGDLTYTHHTDRPTVHRSCTVRTLSILQYVRRGVCHAVLMQVHVLVRPHATRMLFGE